MVMVKKQAWKKCEIYNKTLPGLCTITTFLSNVSYHIHFTFRVYSLTAILWRGWDGGQVKLAMKPVTTVQDCVLTFVSVKPLDYFQLRWPKQVFQAKTQSFPNPNLASLCLNLTGP